LYITSKFSITGSRDGGAPSKFVKPSISLSPIYIKIRVNNQPTEAIVDTRSAISIIHLKFLKTIQHNKFIHQTRTCETANLTPLHIIGQIELEIQVLNTKTFVIAYVSTNLITSILLGNDWINSNHVHLYGDQQRLTIPDQHNQLISIPYMIPDCMNYPALLVNQITLPPHSQTLVDIISQINNAKNLIFEPYGNHISKFIFIPHTLLSVNNNRAKVLLINAQNRQQTLSKNTRIGTLLRDVNFSIFSTTNPTKHNLFSNKNRQSIPRTVSFAKENSNQPAPDTRCHQYNEYFYLVMIYKNIYVHNVIRIRFEKKYPNRPHI